MNGDSGQRRDRFDNRIVAVVGFATACFTIFVRTSDLLSRWLPPATVNVLVGVLFSVALLVGLFGLIAIFINDGARTPGFRGFMVELFRTLRNVLLFLLLPCFILTMLLVLAVMYWPR